MEYLNAMSNKYNKERSGESKAILCNPFMYICDNDYDPIAEV